MNWFVLRKFPLAQDLSALHQFLTSHRIVHRFTEDRGEQALWLADSRYAQELERFIHALESREVSLEQQAYNSQQAYKYSVGSPYFNTQIFA